MKVVKPTPPFGSELTQSGGADRASGRAFSVTVYAAGSGGRGTERPLGHVTIKPGLVAPGRVAAVRTPDGLLRLKRIYYYRDRGGREYVRLESLEPGGAALCYPLGEATVEGEVICVCGADEECGCA